ncbi:GNAT family N-acetyltransferase [Cellulomonas taurus]|uniref:GNAT family N-acetyltransferase n=1 Tax=Cellulomonas taurus TaxID=2729175 RepID=UPI00145F7C2E|nr:GNAT family N-acetyltransferase [Cellulomonas taurus]
MIDLADLTADDLAAWQRLAARAVSPNAFLDPRFLHTVRSGFPESRDLRLVVADQGTEWQGVLAVTTKSMPHRLPGRTTTTGGDFMTSHADRHHPLLDRDRPAAALRALLTGLRSGGLPGLIQLQHLPEDGPVADAVAAVCAGARFGTVERRRAQAPIALRHTVLSRSPAVEPGPLPLLLGHLVPDDAKNVRRRLRGLVREVGAAPVVDLLSDDPALDDEFVALQQAGWKGQAADGGAALHLHPRRERWFREVVAAFRADGDLVGLRLRAGEHTLWIGYLLRSGDSYFGFLDAYAERFHRFSPGVLGRLAALTHVFTATDAPLFDPGFDERYTVGARLFPDRRPQVDLVVATGGLLPRAIVAGWPLGARVGTLARRVEAARARVGASETRAGADGRAGQASDAGRAGADGRAGQVSDAGRVGADGRTGQVSDAGRVGADGRTGQVSDAGRVGRGAGRAGTAVRVDTPPAAPGADRPERPRAGAIVAGGRAESGRATVEIESVDAARATAVE